MWDEEFEARLKLAVANDQENLTFYIKGGQAPGPEPNRGEAGLPMLPARRWDNPVRAEVSTGRID